jgi:hypothetical protein
MRFIVIAIACVLCAACAGRDAAPVATVQPHDQTSDCAMISAEIEANNAKVRELADEKGAKVVQNVAAGVVGIVVWPVLFAMDAGPHAASGKRWPCAPCHRSQPPCRKNSIWSGGSLR